MAYLYFKALHLIFVVTWFAGLFYIVRIFIYQVESNQLAEPERSILGKEYKRNARRLWFGITWPSAVLALVFGLLLIHVRFPTLDSVPTWMWVKLGFLLGMYAYQFSCQSIFSHLQAGNFKYSSQKLRVWNEVATIFLIAIIFLAVLKSTVSLLWGLLGLVVFTGALLLAIKIYKHYREKNA